MPPFTTLGLDYFEHVETTSASPQALWARWVDVATWEDWSGWSGRSRRSPVLGLLELESQGVVVDRFGRKVSFIVTALDRFRSMEISLKAPKATIVMRYEIVGANKGMTSFCHSVRIEGPCARLWRRSLRLRFEREAPTDMRRLARLADDSGINGRDRERLGHI